MRDPTVQKFLEETTLDPAVAGKRPRIDLAGPRGVSPKKEGRKPGWRKPRCGDAADATGLAEAARPFAMEADATPRAAASPAPAACQPPAMNPQAPAPGATSPDAGSGEDQWAAALNVMGTAGAAACPPMQGPTLWLPPPQGSSAGRGLGAALLAATAAPGPADAAGTQ